ncbi:hypothetical protein T439DRAFT_327172 [Meredithblackwellia eburnea MCA 4105]
MSEEEQQFTIQPHPAKTNNPADLVSGGNAESTPGLGGAPNLAHLHQGNPLEGKGGPHVVSKEIAEGLEKPKTREELQALAAKLNE